MTFDFEKEEETECCDNCEDGKLNEICGTCNGSGEGQYDGSTCSICGGKGIETSYCSCPRGDERLAEEVF